MAEAADIEGWLGDLAEPARVPNQREQAMLKALHQAIRQVETAPQPDDLGLARLHARLRREGYYRPRQRMWQPRWAATAAVVVLAAGVMLEWAVFDPTLQPERVELPAPDYTTPAVSGTEVVELQSAAPQPAVETPAAPVRQQRSSAPREKAAAESLRDADAAPASPPALAAAPEPRLLEEDRQVRKDLRRERAAPAAIGFAEDRAAEYRPQLPGLVQLEIFVAEPVAARRQLQEFVDAGDGITLFDQADFGEAGFGLGLQLATAADRAALDALLAKLAPEGEWPAGQTLWLRVRPR